MGFVAAEGVSLMSLLRWLILLCSLPFYLITITNFSKENIFMKALVVLFAIFFVYGFQVIVAGKTFGVTDANGYRKIPSTIYLLRIISSLLPIFVFYYFARKRVLTKKFIVKRITPFVLFVTVCFILSLRALMEKKGSEDVTNNFGYVVLTVMPLLVFLGKSMKQYLFFSFCFILILLSVKRGAILISIIIAGMYIHYWLRSKSLKVKLLAAVLLLCVGIAGEMIMSRNQYFQKRLDNTIEGNSSGRDFYYLFFIDYYINKTTGSEFLVGRGANGTLEIFSNYAHNDWLEIAINQGVLGLIIYSFYWFAFLLLCKRNLNSEAKYAIWMLFVIYFMKTLFSMSYSAYNVFSGMVLGYCISQAYGLGSKRIILIVQNYKE